MPATPSSQTLTRILGSVILFGVLGGAAYGLYAYKQGNRAAAQAAAAAMPEPAEAVQAAEVTLRPYTRTSTAIGTVRALRSITLQSELAGTVREVHLTTGALVNEGDLLVQLDVAVETAQQRALEAEARLAATMLGRMERALERQGASEADVDRARAEQDMAIANVARLQAVIDQKRICAPFRARVGLVDLNVGQYVQPGTTITTLQGVADSVHVDFSVTQDVASALREDTQIEVVIASGTDPLPATVVALDSRVDATTRNAVVRAELHAADLPADTVLPRPGASVRVRIPVSAERDVAVVPVSALRRGPAGNSVYVLEPDPQGNLRAHERRVDSGPMVGSVVLIHAGLQTGERVATVGSFKLREAALVQVIDPAAAEAGR